MTEITREDVTQIFGEKGLLSEKLESYTPREGQQFMATKVLEAIECQEHLMVEAPTGTGKSLAAGIPAVLHAVHPDEKPVVYVTSGIALQEQLITKDLPLIAEVLNGQMLDENGEELIFDYALLKGMSNYLCKLKLDEEVEADHLHSEIVTMAAWAAKTETGDRSELSKEDPKLWSRVSTGSEECLGRKCPWYDSCFVFDARRKAKDVSLVVTNYHMWFSDMQVKQSTGGNGFLPDHDVVIMDEAHDAPGIAMDFQGFQLSMPIILALVRELRKVGESYSKRAKRKPGSVEELANKTTAYVRKCAEDFFEMLTELKKKNGKVIEAPPGEDCGLSGALEGAANAYTAKIAQLEGTDDPRKRIYAERLKMKAGLCHGRSTLLKSFCWGIHYDGEEEQRLGSIQDLGEFERGRVHYLEDNQQSVELCCKDVNPQRFFRREVFNRKTAIMTSATLAADGEDFNFKAAQFGLSKGEYTALVAPPAFNQERTICVVPKDFPDHSNREAHVRAVARATKVLTQISPGGVMVLFTSIKAKSRVADILREGGLCNGVTILVQGELPKMRIIQEFKHAYNRGRKALILATASFWQGVDISGQALSVVAIDKIPFPTPDDPVLYHLKRTGADWFMDYSLPTALISVKQGAGRLIRSEKDYGAICVFDTRIHSKGYGGQFYDAIPAWYRDGELSAAKDFFEDALDGRFD